MPHREEADNADLAFKHAERTAKALEKELFAWQSINSNIRAMYGAAGVAPMKRIRPLARTVPLARTPGRPVPPASGGRRGTLASPAR